MPRNAHIRLSFFLLIGALSTALSYPTESLAASSCRAETKLAKKHCLKKGQLCRKSTAKLNQCLKRAAERVPPGLVCFALYQPVCAVEPGGEPQAFANSCEAARAGAAVLPSSSCAMSGK